MPRLRETCEPDNKSTFLVLERRRTPGGSCQFRYFPEVLFPFLDRNVDKSPYVLVRYQVTMGITEESFSRRAVGRIEIPLPESKNEPTGSFFQMRWWPAEGKGVGWKRQDGKKPKRLEWYSGSINRTARRLTRIWKGTTALLSRVNEASGMRVQRKW